MSEPKDAFVHLHTHSAHSLLDGLETIEELVEEVSRLGQPAVALTEHGSLFRNDDMRVAHPDDFKNGVDELSGYFIHIEQKRFTHSNDPIGNKTRKQIFNHATKNFCSPG